MNFLSALVGWGEPDGWLRLQAESSPTTRGGHKAGSSPAVCATRSVVSGEPLHPSRSKGASGKDRK